jgi:hypothetical protein
MKFISLPLPKGLQNSYRKVSYNYTRENLSKTGTVNYSVC